MNVLIDGYTADELLRLFPEHLDELVVTDLPLVLRVGSAEILGQLHVSSGCLVVELAHIEGGGEGVLPTLWLTAERYAKLRNLEAVEWVVHALNCANPNPKLRRVLERRGFTVQDVGGIGPAYYYWNSIPGSADDDQPAAR